MRNSTKHIKTYLRKLRKTPRNSIYQDKLSKFQTDIKKTWTIMKEIAGKIKVKENSFSRNLTIGDNFFVNISPKLASVIPNSTKTFQTFLPETNTVLNGTELTEKEFLDALQCSKNDKSPGFDKLHVNVIKFVYNEIKAPLMHVFRNYIDNGSFPEKIIIAKVTPIFKAAKRELVSNYRPISVLPCFFKILERIMHNRLYSYFDQNKILYGKQFGFRACHSTDHALVQ